MTQSNTITFDAIVTPQIFDKTKPWAIRVGYGNHGIAGKVDFPVGGSD